jgi:hypothetical protein
MPGPMQSSGPSDVRPSRHCDQVTTARCQDDRVLMRDAVGSSRQRFGSSRQHHGQSTVLPRGVSHFWMPQLCRPSNVIPRVNIRTMVK